MWTGFTQETDDYTFQAGTAVDVFLFPLDTIKTRLQSPQVLDPIVKLLTSPSRVSCLLEGSAESMLV